MKKRKTLQELTIKDNFLFGAVVSREKSIVYHPEYKGVRLDIYAEDEKHTHYNVEMQVKKKAALGKRSRYYHSQMVMEAVQFF